ncbi:MAG: type II toxin-antitoxin system HicB family antitoxin [Magnetococcales bacterium]|nr:type II toxin-antitoxin system HicB family antitoxin [Magnetococcales bacterium]
MNYPIVIHKDHDSDYGVTVPDLPGCFSAGETLEVAAAMAVEAIQTHVEGLLLGGDPIPLPQPLEVHQASPEYAGSLWMLVSVDLGKIQGKAKRINVTIPEPALARIDQYARTHGETRSSFLVRAALQAMR